MIRMTRRTALKLSGALACAPLLSRIALAQENSRSHGMAVIGDLKYGRDFERFEYVNPDAPHGGRIVTQLSQWGANQNPVTFNTLNIYVLRGDGAAGMALTFAGLMSGSSDEPGSVYGLVAKEVEISDDRKALRFFLRPEAVFHDGSQLTAHDAAFSLEKLRDEGHPNIATQLLGMAEIKAEDDHTLFVRLKPESGRSLPNTVAGMPIFSRAWWEGRDFQASLSEAPLGSGPYKLADYRFGSYIEFERVADWWADELPVMVGQYNFDRIRYEYYRDRTASFEAFKKGAVTFREEFTSRSWATGYDFPALTQGRVVKDEVPDGRPAGAQGWFINMRRAKFSDPRVRLALVYAFDFEWTNTSIMFGSYRRTHSFFENSPLKAEGAPSPEELELLEPLRAQLPEEVFGEAFVPPVSDGSGRDRAMLQKATELLKEAGCERTSGGLLAPDGSPFTIEFLDDDAVFEPHHNAYIAGLKLLGIQGSYRVVDPAQYNDRMKGFDFDMVVSRFSMPLYPDETIQQFFASDRAEQEGSYNLSGIAEPAIDQLLKHVVNAEDWDVFVTASRALDRALRAKHFWVPQWNKGTHWFAYWDMFSRPEIVAKYDPGVLDTWWFDEEKAAKIGKAG
ncbi:MAG: extracellular solute-binding protein [Propylenella sp.]